MVVLFVGFQQWIARRKTCSSVGIKAIRVNRSNREVPERVTAVKHLRRSIYAE